MSVHRKRYSAEEKTRVAIEAIKGQKTLNELAAEYGVPIHRIENVKAVEVCHITKEKSRTPRYALPRSSTQRSNTASQYGSACKSHTRTSQPQPNQYHNEYLRSCSSFHAAERDGEDEQSPSKKGVILFVLCHLTQPLRHKSLPAAMNSGDLI